MEEIIEKWGKLSRQASGIESSQRTQAIYPLFPRNDRPQIKSERNLEGGMAVSVGRLRPDTQYDVKFVSIPITRSEAQLAVLC